ncbi:MULTISPECIES: SGNH/GDSL hydrolase family protein [unclassified Azospirillum]|uniref:SGNH/GDSL hydrolase family protein n=1 Tax=unclassified Azospirillum TaxID=2630922 RepID=UPI000B6376CB|nr:MULTISPECIES: SGNH/GDSL hydrolase family protein [unclassified Azospirillum]SNS57005.1 GDSL-like Lipase/Acylhydrolase family protein [Azospirillum sp. RU38E]SNS76580.1 GDSL-like Lipase/Acylhydrolase family protein [Azospirillum sp. RU37A]
MPSQYRSTALAAALLLAGFFPVTAQAAAKYVAMGSSFAAGPGITPYVADAPPRCGRSTRNYAHQLAERRGLDLVDVSCSGATTAAILEPWNELPAQIDAVDRDTALVTVTIGGNDVFYIGNLMSASCQELAGQGKIAADKCRPPQTATEADYARLEEGLRRIAAGVKQRAPKATLVFLDYPVVLPSKGTCAATPLPDEAATAARAATARVEALTAKVAQEAGAKLIKVSALSQGHDACAAEPWMTGFASAGGVPYHPNLAGMTAQAAALEGLLGRP